MPEILKYGLNIDKEQVPAHVAIILDGNGRWAKLRNLPRTEGHRRGVNNLERIMEAARELHVKVLTLYVFSKENWGRPKKEVDFLMGLVRDFIKRELQKFKKKGIRLIQSGDMNGVPSNTAKSLKNAFRETEDNKDFIMNIAFNYGSRQEILRAVNGIINNYRAGKLKKQKINEKDFKNHLYHPELPDPELMIRTSGELRISNFLTWQMAYTEFYFTKILWPDFGKKEFYKAVYEYQRRSRRFGGI